MSLLDTEPEPEEPTESPSLYYFLGLIFLWLIPCFIVWVSLNSLLAAPAVWVANIIMTYSMPEFVHELALSGSQAILSTNFGSLNGEIVAAQEAGYRMGLPLDTRILSYSLPFYAALFFATQTSSRGSGNSVTRFAGGLALLYPLLVLGLVSVSVKNLMVTLGGLFIESGSIQASVIGLLFQLNTLIIPTLAPVLIWAWQSRDNPLLIQLLRKNSLLNPRS